MKILTPVFINNENYITGHISHAANDQNEILCKTSFKTGFRRLPPIWKIEEGNPNCVHCLKLLQGLKCPKCGSPKVRKNGKKGKTQYYVCVQCHCRFLEKVEVRDSRDCLGRRQMSQIMTESKASVEDGSSYVTRYKTKPLATKKKENFKDKIRQIVLRGDLSNPKTTQDIFNNCEVKSNIKIFYEAIWELEDEGVICRKRDWTRNLILQVTWLPGENNSEFVVRNFGGKNE